MSEAAPSLANDILGLANSKLESIVDDAARFNRDAGVSGVMLFDGQRFLCYLEGPKDGLAVAYSRALGAASHAGVIELWRGKLPERLVPFWTMECLPVEASQLSQFVHLFETESSSLVHTGSIGVVVRDYLAQIVAPYRPPRESET